MTHIFEDGEGINATTCAFLGMKGMGKTKALSLLARDLAEEGNHVIVFDTLGAMKPEDVGSKFFYVHSIRGKDWIRHMIKFLKGKGGGVNVVFDLSDFDLEELYNMSELVCSYLLSVQNRKVPTWLVIDELADYLRQGKKFPFSRTLERLIRIGRNYKIMFAGASQRTQLVDKDTLALVDSYIIFRMMHALDREMIKQLLGHSQDEFKEIDKKLQKLDIRQVIVHTPRGLRETFVKKL